MRTKKFRAWSKRAQCMISWNEIVEKKNLHKLIDNPEYILMQYTGLNDSEGMEIFEDDIVEVGYDTLSNLVVKFEDGAYNISSYYIKNCRIIGNIHQNPGLLNDK